MEGTHNEVSKTNTPSEGIFLDFGDDDFSFKPITKGLGLDHKHESSTSFTRNLNVSFKNNSKSIEKNEPRQFLDLAKSIQIEGDHNITESRPRTEKVKTESRQYILAKPFEKMFSFGIDITIISATITALYLAFMFIQNMGSNVDIKVVPTIDILFFTLLLFNLIYIFYFSIFDLLESPGKSLMSLKVVGIKNGKIELKHTFIRSVVSLISCYLIFLPMILDFHGKLSDTKVVKDKS